MTLKSLKSNLQLLAAVLSGLILATAWAGLGAVRSAADGSAGQAVMALALLGALAVAAVLFVVANRAVAPVAHAIEVLGGETRRLAKGEGEPGGVGRRGSGDAPSGGHQTGGATISLDAGRHEPDVCDREFAPYQK